MVPHLPTCLRITPISAYFSPIFRLWYPILIINSSICCPFAVFPPTCLRILLIFCLFSAYFPPKIPPIFRPSCLAGNCTADGNIKPSNLERTFFNHFLQSPCRTVSRRVFVLVCPRQEAFEHKQLPAFL